MDGAIRTSHPSIASITTRAFFLSSAARRQIVFSGCLWFPVCNIAQAVRSRTVGDFWFGNARACDYVFSKEDWPPYAGLGMVAGHVVFFLKNQLPAYLEIRPETPNFWTAKIGAPEIGL